MEPKRIHESALLPHNDVNRVVFEMFRAGFLAMQASRTPSVSLLLGQGCMNEAVQEPTGSCDVFCKRAAFHQDKASRMTQAIR